jgi:hypothetical protein
VDIRDLNSRQSAPERNGPSVLPTLVAFTDDQRITPSPDVLGRVLDGEAVLLDLASGTYFGLNDVASRIWELVATGVTVGALREAMLAEFEVGAETLTADLESLLVAMQARGLIRIG